MKHLFVFSLAAVFGILGLITDQAVASEGWRLVLAMLSGAAGGAGMALSLLHIRQLRRR